MDYIISIFIRAYLGLRGKVIVEEKDGINLTFKRVNVNELFKNLDDKNNVLDS